MKKKVRGESLRKVLTSKEITKLFMEFMASFKQGEPARSQNECIHHFLSSQIEQGPFFVISRAEENTIKKSMQSSRIIYGKEELDKSLLVNKEFNSYLNHCHSKKWDLINHDNGQYLVFFLENNEQQNTFGCVKILHEIEESLIEIFVNFIHQARQVNQAKDDLKKLEELVHTDDVTGLFNQRKMKLDLEKLVNEHAKFNDEFSILFVDIDHFKQVNDNYGHLVGSKVLFDVASIISSVVRETDQIYRYGGDEFVVLLANTTGPQAKMVGERLLDSIKKFSFNIESKIQSHVTSLNLSVSIGVAAYPSDATTMDDILDIADQMMYKAKKGGRGKVCFTHDIFESTVALGK